MTILPGTTGTRRETLFDVRRSETRFHARHGWLETRHSFSFAEYWDPDNVSFGALRVFNDDVVEPREGFPSHPHRDMEIVTVVLHGALSHRDSTGGEGVLRPGDVQHMTAGTGVVHSEYNASEEVPVHLLQMWVLPRQQGLAPAYHQATFPRESRQNRLLRVVSPDGGGGTLPIAQDASMFLGEFEAGVSLEHAPVHGRRLYLHVIGGVVDVNGERLGHGDAARIITADPLRLQAHTGAEVLLWDLA
jgi:redox-sensitive bicupin YhaK (pirin superfamily)